MRAVHIMPNEFENAAITSHFGIFFEEKLGQEIT